MLEGEFEFLDDGETIRASAGSLIYVSKGHLHISNNVGISPGRFLISQTPDSLLEGLFEEVGEEAVDTSTPPVMKCPPDIEGK